MVEKLFALWRLPEGYDFTLDVALDDKNENILYNNYIFYSNYTFL
jgi:hypothetical protein